MSPWAFRAALRATARVAMGVTAAAGCGGTVAPSPQEAPRVQADASGESWSEAGIGAVADAAEHPDARVDAEASAEASALEPQVCGAPPAADLLPESPDAGAQISQGTFDCCVATVSTLASTDAGVMIGDLPDSGAAGTDVTTCCAAIVARLDYEELSSFGAQPDASAWNADESASAGVRWACCAAVGHPEGPTCTPWGPPTPPAMPASLREVA